MEKQLPDAPKPVFEQIKRLDENGVEYWSARDLGKVLEYLEYRNFQPAIERAKEACLNSGHRIADHFVDMHEMVSIGSGAQREMPSIKLSRYAWCLRVLKSWREWERRRLEGGNKKGGISAPQ